MTNLQAIKKVHEQFAGRLREKKIQWRELKAQRERDRLRSIEYLVDSGVPYSEAKISVDREVSLEEEIFNAEARKKIRYDKAKIVKAMGLTMNTEVY